MRVISLARVDIKFKIQTIMSVLRDVVEEIKLVVKFNEFSESYGFNPWLVKWRKNICQFNGEVCLSFC